MSKKKGYEGAAVQIHNKKARHHYQLEETLEAGIVLQGTEVKSIRLGKAQITEAFVRFDQLGNAVLYGAHIDEYAFGNQNNHNPNRPRRLLLHKKELRKLQGAVEAGGKTIVPLKVYFKGGFAKVTISIATGKNVRDKREALKEKSIKRETAQAIKGQYR